MSASSRGSRGDDTTTPAARPNPERITDERAMAEAVALAERGWGRVHPNPLVGAVVVRDGAVVGRGWHAEYGGPHAEAVALEDAGARARGATMFVSLEPCAHHGKQPPCVEAILAAGIARVVFAVADPDPVARGGAEKLRAAGVRVEEWLANEAAARGNFRFLHRFGGVPRPFVALKLAVSLDGMVADARGRSQWLSGPQAREWVHRLRAGFGAVAVGGVTALADDVRLTVRGAIEPRVPPVRVVFDRSGRIPAGHGIFDDVADVPVTMILGATVAATRRQELERRGATVLVADELADALGQLAQRGVDSILIEGGGRLASGFWRAGLVDRIYQIVCPLWLGAGTPAWPDLGPIALAEARRWQTVGLESAGDDAVLVMEP